MVTKRRIISPSEAALPMYAPSSDPSGSSLILKAWQLNGPCLFLSHEDERDHAHLTVLTNMAPRTRIVGLLLCAAFLLPLQAQRVPVVEKTLTNGMRMLMVERHDEPS